MEFKKKIHSFSTYTISYSTSFDTYEFVLEALYYIQLTDKTPSALSAGPLLNAIREFEFNFVLHSLYDVFERTGILSDALQDSELEIDRSILLKETTIKSLNEINTEASFEILYNKCIQFAIDNELEEPLLPRPKKIPSRFKESFPDKPQFVTAIDKYKSLYFNIIDTNIKEIKERFEDETLLISNTKYGKSAQRI